VSKLKTTRLVNKLVELGLSTTAQARVIGDSVSKVKNIQQGRPFTPLLEWQIEKLEEIKGVLK